MRWCAIDVFERAGSGADTCCPLLEDYGDAVEQTVFLTKRIMRGRDAKPFCSWDGDWGSMKGDEEEHPRLMRGR